MIFTLISVDPTAEILYLVMINHYQYRAMVTFYKEIEFETHIKVMMRQVWSYLILVGISCGLAYAELKVITLHPFLNEVTLAVGGSEVVLVDLMGLSKNPHVFEPSPRDLIHLAKADIVLASGKGLESNLHKFRDNLKSGASLVEVGRTIPSYHIEPHDEMLESSPKHSNGVLDPHWWHSLEAMKRASRIVAKAFAEIDPDHQEAYRKRARAYRKELDALQRWAKKEVSTIPPSQRYLATTHLAFGYFCKEFGFKAVGIQGVNKEQKPSPAFLAESINVLRAKKITVMFPEISSNNRALQSIAKETGITLGQPLVADILTDEITTYSQMYRHNVNAIVNSLRPKE